jgi:hypothetical protein
MNKTTLRTLMGIAWLSALTGCVTIPEVEYADFKPLPRNQRVIQEVKLTWDVRPDASEYCGQRLAAAGKTVGGMAGTPVACATWVRSTGVCTIVTNANPNHVVLGHELRHCFEGHFH